MLSASKVLFCEREILANPDCGGLEKVTDTAPSCNSPKLALFYSGFVSFPLTYTQNCRGLFSAVISGSDGDGGEDGDQIE